MTPAGGLDGIVIDHSWVGDQSPGRHEGRPGRRRGRSVAGASLWLHEVRRCGPAALALPILAATGIVVASVALRATHVASNVASTQAASLTMMRLVSDLFPVTAGLATAAVVGRECLMELQLSAPTSYATTLRRRLCVVGVVVLLGAVVCVAVLGVDHQWQRTPHGPLALLMPGGPAVLLIGAGTWAGVVLRSTAGGSTMVVGVWLAQILILDHYLGGWQVNRPLVVVAGLALLGLAWRRLSDTEAMLSGGGE
ncbi:MAG: hypothetical protein ACRDY2_10965 [Acidimicrobiales bacterium]